MKKAYVITICAAFCFMYSSLHAQPIPNKAAQGAAGETKVPPDHSKSNSYVDKSDGKAVAPYSPSVVPATPTPSSAQSTDVVVVTAKELLTANNQMVSNLATMYQNLGLYITIMVTLVGGVAGGVATWMSIVARRSVKEFIEEWKEKLKSIETEMNESLRKLRDSEAAAAGSAKQAELAAQSIKDSEKVLDTTLKAFDALKAKVDALGNGPPIEPSAIADRSNEANVSAAEVKVTANEAADVSNLLEGKLKNPDGEQS